MSDVLGGPLVKKKKRIKRGEKATRLYFIIFCSKKGGGSSNFLMLAGKMTSLLDEKGEGEEWVSPWPEGGTMSGLS